VYACKSGRSAVDCRQRRELARSHPCCANVELPQVSILARFSPRPRLKPATGVEAVEVIDKRPAMNGSDIAAVDSLRVHTSFRTFVSVHIDKLIARPGTGMLCSSSRSRDVYEQSQECVQVVRPERKSVAWPGFQDQREPTAMSHAGHAGGIEMKTSPPGSRLSSRLKRA